MGQAEELAALDGVTVLSEVVELVDVGVLRLHPENPREGDIGAIAESIRENGFYGAVVAQYRTGHVLVGNHRLQAAQLLGMAQVPVLWVDVDDQRALKIMLADNRTNDRASYDNAVLNTLLQRLAADGELVGTGYDDEDVAELAKLVEGGWDADVGDKADVDPEPPDPEAGTSVQWTITAPHALRLQVQEVLDMLEDRHGAQVVVREH
jgi:ParB-like chromosome segregation protein Spo0J